MSKSASNFFPRETGGIFLGYWNLSKQQAVLKFMIGPGPKAHHAKRSFIPDYEYQEREMKRRYVDSKRRLVYLGDWHTHPYAKGLRMSRRDRRTLKRIADFPAARAPKPIMAILAGQPEDWSLRVWSGERRHIGGLRVGFKLRPMIVKKFSP